MTLDFDKIKEIAKGAVTVELSAGWVELHRYTKAQRDNYLYTMQKPIYYNRALCTAGIRLAFETDSDFFAFEYITGENTSNSADYVMDLYQDGEMTGSMRICKKDSVIFALKRGTKRVELYLPWAVQLKLRNVTVSDGAFINGMSRSKKMLMYGDSITQGYYNSHPSLAYMTTFARLFDADAVNKGIGSERYLGQTLVDADGFVPDLITIAYGTNDWNSCTYEVAHADCERYFEKLEELYPSVKKIVITPIWRTDTSKQTQYGKSFFEVHNDIKAVCDRYKDITVINGIDLVPHDKALYQDSAHPNTDGQTQYGINLYKKIKALF